MALALYFTIKRHTFLSQSKLNVKPSHIALLKSFQNIFNFLIQTLVGYLECRTYGTLFFCCVGRTFFQSKKFDVSKLFPELHSKSFFFRKLISRYLAFTGLGRVSAGIIISPFRHHRVHLDGQPFVTTKLEEQHLQFLLVIWYNLGFGLVIREIHATF